MHGSSTMLGGPIVLDPVPCWGDPLFWIQYHVGGTHCFGSSTMLGGPIVLDPVPCWGDPLFWIQYHVGGTTEIFMNVT